VTEIVRETLIRRSRRRLETVRENDRLDGSLGFDSFALLNVVLDLEDRFGVEIEPAKLAEVRALTFRQLVTLVESEISARTAAEIQDGPAT